MCYLNAIMVSCFKRDERESADGYFCFTLEHRVSRQTLFMRLMQRMLSSAQCLAGGPFEFFFRRAKWSRGLVRGGGKAAFVGCLKIDSELFHQLGALANAFASRHRLTRLYGLMDRVLPLSVSPPSLAGHELKTLRPAHEPRHLADESYCAGDKLAKYGVRGPVKDGTSRASRDSADRQLERNLPNVWHSLTASQFSIMVCFQGTLSPGSWHSVQEVVTSATFAAPSQWHASSRRASMGEGSLVDQMHNEAVEALAADECCNGAQNQREAVPSAFRRSQGINYTRAYARPQVLQLPDDPAHYVRHIRSHRRHDRRQHAT